jgi:hypothetical protein
MPDSSSVLSWLLLIAFLAGCVLLLWLARRIEPHWVSRNGRQFTCRVAELFAERSEVGTWSEARVAINGDDSLTVAVKPKFLRLPGPRNPIRVFRVAGRADSDRKGLVVYLLTGEQQMALRVPKRSRAVAMLDELAKENGPAGAGDAP